MLKDRRIALIEDDEIMGASIEQRLRLEGAEVLWLKQMQRAIGALRTPVRRSTRSSATSACRTAQAKSCSSPSAGR